MEIRCCGQFLCFTVSTVIAGNAVSQRYLVEKRRTIIASSCKFGYSFFYSSPKFYKVLIELKILSSPLSGDNSEFTVVTEVGLALLNNINQLSSKPDILYLFDIVFFCMI